MTALELDDDFQKYLKEDHYSFVAPVDSNLLDQFIKTVSKIAPSGFLGTIHKSLSNREATREALRYFPDTEVRVYIMASRSPSILLHSTVPDYCRKMNIEYP